MKGKRLPDPFCSECGYSLVGLTDSSRCPECGRPLVEVLQRDALTAGYRYTSRTIIFGLPLLQIAQGPHEKEKHGHAKGIIAIGDYATGWFALGGFARGIVAIGGFSMGLFAIGGLTCGVFPMGGLALGLFAIGAVSAGLFAIGGTSLGVVAIGGIAVGYYGIGGVGAGAHLITEKARDTSAVEFFQLWQSMLTLGSVRTGTLQPVTFLAALFWYVGLLALTSGTMLLVTYLACKFLRRPSKATRGT